MRTFWSERVERYARDAAAETRPFAEALVALAAPGAGARVLDVACGPGGVAVAAAQRVGPRGAVLATDIVPEWQPYVAAAAEAAGVANVAFAAMSAEALTLPDRSFDAALCQFGLMFVPDPRQALREMHRVLRPGGTLGVTVWSVPEKVGLFLITRIVGAALPPPPGDRLPSPTSMGEPALIEGLIAGAGFVEIITERKTTYREVADPEEEWQRWTAEPQTPAARGLAALPPAEQTRLHDEAIAAFAAFRDGNTFRVPSEAVMVRATKGDGVLGC